MLFTLAFALIAAAEEPQAPSPDAPPAQTPAELPVETALPPERAALRPLAALSVGPSIPLSSLGVSLFPRLSVGAQLPVMDGRVRAFASFSTAQAQAEVSQSDARVPTESWSATLTEALVNAGVGATIAVLPISSKVIPEVGLLSGAQWSTSSVVGAAGDSPIGETRERTVQWTTSLLAGGRYALGPGELLGQLELSLSGFDGEITGDKTASFIAPQIGYALLF